jgi:hypothetical protein
MTAHPSKKENKGKNRSMGTEEGSLMRNGLHLFKQQME